MELNIRIVRTAAAAVLAVMAAFAAPAAAQGGPRWLVPAYASPCCDDGPALWAALLSTAQTRPQQLAVIVNPDSGPGVSPIDPNFVNAAGQGPLVTLDATGALLIGYISTDYGNRDINLVRTEMTRFYSAAYWRNTSVRLDGFFFDEMSSDLADVGYYRLLRDHARALDADALLIGNPGIYSYDNPSSQTTYSATDYGSVFDVLVLYEFNDLAVNRNYLAPDWLSAPGAAQISFIVYGAITGARARVALSRMLARNGKYLYLTDDGLPNPYDQLPTLWNAQLGWLDELIFVDNWE